VNSDARLGGKRSSGTADRVPEQPADANSPASRRPHELFTGVPRGRRGARYRACLLPGLFPATRVQDGGCHPGRPGLRGCKVHTSAGFASSHPRPVPRTGVHELQNALASTRNEVRLAPRPLGVGEGTRSSRGPQHATTIAGRLDENQHTTILRWRSVANREDWSMRRSFTAQTRRRDPALFFMEQSQATSVLSLATDKSLPYRLEAHQPSRQVVPS